MSLRNPWQQRRWQQQQTPKQKRILKFKSSHRQMEQPKALRSRRGNCNIFQCYHIEISHWILSHHKHLDVTPYFGMEYCFKTCTLIWWIILCVHRLISCYYVWYIFFNPSLFLYWKKGKIYNISIDYSVEVFPPTLFIVYILVCIYFILLCTFILLSTTALFSL